VESTPVIDAVLAELEPFAAEAGVKMVITSGLRDPQDQLRVIAGYAAEHGVSFPEFDANDPHKKVRLADGRDVYAWQRTWSRLLFIGIVINPPLAAECLEDYIRPNGENMKGKLLQGSVHGNGKAFDEQADGNLKDAQDEVPKKIAVLEKAKAAGVKIKGWKVERKNNAIHVDCA
jgi:hypothetical protein